jgi:hypothetical protein
MASSELEWKTRKRILVERDHPNLMLPDKILRIAIKPDVVEPRFLVHALRSRRVRDYFEANATGTSNSMPKQRQIADEIERLLALANTIEQRASAALGRIKSLPAAILAKAFAGELVPTEAELAREEGRTYETAQQMLARIRPESASNESSKNKHRRRAPANAMSAKEDV